MIPVRTPPSGELRLLLRSTTMAPTQFDAVATVAAARVEKHGIPNAREFGW